MDLSWHIPYSLEGYKVKSDFLEGTEEYGKYGTPD
jgi:hypothetical protein